METGSFVNQLTYAIRFPSGDIHKPINIDCHISKYLGEIERGKANLTIDITEKISVALNVEISVLFDYQHEMGRKALKENINSLIREANDKDLQTIFRILKSALR